MRKQADKSILKDILNGKANAKSLLQPVWYGIRIWKSIGPGLYQDHYSERTITDAELEAMAQEPGPVTGFNIVVRESSHPVEPTY